MAVKLIEQRIAAVLAYDKDEVKGSTISVQVEGEEKKSSPNDEEVVVFFPKGFNGSREVVIEGSKSGSDSGTIQVG